jgi:hypothetical protein
MIISYCRVAGKYYNVFGFEEVSLVSKRAGAYPAEFDFLTPLGFFIVEIYGIMFSGG